MDGKSPIMERDRRRDRVEPDPILSFVETGELEPRPRLLVDRLLYARTLLQTSGALAPRFALGYCAAAHHIVLGSAAASGFAVERLLAYGFRVEPSSAPPGILFFLSSSHAEAEIRALLVAIVIVIRELSASDASRPRRIASGTAPAR
jgi:hypothetical protein